MAASTTSFPIAVATPASPAEAARTSRRRRITPEAGRALEILGHAIEYLADEYVHMGNSFSARDGELQAMQLLMSRNREIYFACPTIPTFWERCRGWLTHRAA